MGSHDASILGLTMHPLQNKIIIMQLFICFIFIERYFGFGITPTQVRYIILEVIFYGFYRQRPRVVYRVIGKWKIRTKRQL